MPSESSVLLAATDDELRRTQQPSKAKSEFFWESDSLRRIGSWGVNMETALSPIKPELKESFKNAVTDFIIRGDYSASVYQHCFSTIANSLRQCPSECFDDSWLAQATKSNVFKRNIGAIRSFFIQWNDSNPAAVSESVMQMMVKIKPPTPTDSNVLSDDPELSWLTDTEYETILLNVWSNYESDNFSVSRTFALLLSMQYARRPVQLAQLKIGDFQIAKTTDVSGLTGPVVAFPGAKDIGAETNFRDSKFETHPLPEHLWNLFELQRNHVRVQFKTQLSIELSDAELDELPVFTTKHRIQRAVSNLRDHYSLDWKANLDHSLFHLMPERISRNLGWTPEVGSSIVQPLSHRTGRPIKVSATRMRHTRARQLARKGIPRHVLSHWLGHTSEKSLEAYYNDPAEDARQLDEAMAPALVPLAMAFAGTLIDSEEQASRYDDPNSRLEFATDNILKSVGHCGKHSFCATTSVPVPCYRCKHFVPLVSAPHGEVLEALTHRQAEEKKALKIGGARNLLVPIDLSADIQAVQNCIDRCNARKAGTV